MRPNPASSFTRFFAAPTRPLAAAALACALLAAPPATRAQDCDAPSWSTAFTSGRFDNTPHCLLSRGPDLIAGGRFEEAGGLPIPGVARWDGQAWQPMGEGLPWRVRVLIDFDSGNGPLLYACGSLIDGNNDGGARIARWNGQSWDPIAGGPDGGIRAAAVLDDGSGPALFCVGSFTQIAGVSAAGAARFDGHSWTSLGSGLTGYANAAAIFDDGAGPALFVGGKFTAAGGIPVSNLARWNGAEWADVGGGVSGNFAEVNTLAAHAEDNKSNLYIGGFFSTLGDDTPSNYAGAWDGEHWTPITGANTRVTEFGESPDGESLRLYAGTSANGIDGNLFILSGTHWKHLDANFGTEIRAMTHHDADGPPSLHVSAGAFVWLLRDGQWTALDRGLTEPAEAMVEVNLGEGPEIIVATNSKQAAGQPIMGGLAAWNGSTWRSILANGSAAPSSLVIFDDGQGPTLFAAMGTHLARVQRLVNDEWLPVGQLTYASGTDLIVFDDGSGTALYSCGGDDYEANMFGVVKLQGDSWVPVGVGLSGGNGVDDLEVYNDGDGPALYAAGDFEYAGPVKVHGIARWDGKGWTRVGTGLPTANDITKCLTVFDDGNGPALYVGGEFSKAGGVPVNNIARWDGKEWSGLGNGVEQRVLSMAPFDDGTGPALYVSGSLTVAGEMPVSGIAKWNRGGWQPVGSGFNTYGHAKVMLPSSLSGGSLFLGGTFTSADGVSSGNFAQLIGCYPCFADFDHDGAPTLFDFLAFVNAFNAEDPAADCDHSQSLDLFDFLCFTNSFNQGC